MEARLIGFGGWVILVLVWVVSAVVTGGLLALLAKRIHPSLSFPRLWAFYTLLMAVTAAVVMLIGWF